MNAWDACASRYSNAEEMMSGYRGLHARLSRPAVVVDDTNVVLTSTRNPISKTYEPSTPDPEREVDPEPVTNLWIAPVVSEMPIVEAPDQSAWRRFIDELVIVMIEGEDHFCPSLSSPKTHVARAVFSGETEPPRLPNGRIPLTNKDLLKAVAAKHEMSVIEMIATRRDAKTVIARQEAIWWFRKLTEYSLPTIGQIFGGRDHTTMIHAIRRHQQRIDAGEAF